MIRQVIKNFSFNKTSLKSRHTCNLHVCLFNISISMQKILFLCIFVSNLSYAQDKTGYQWFLYNFNHIDFREMPPKVSLFSPLPFYETGSTGTITMCNKYGDFMFQTGGCFIANKNFDIMKNGDSINSTYTYHAWCKFMEGDGDFPLTQSSIALPYPKKDSFYLSFNLDFDNLEGSNLPTPMHLYYSTIDMRQDSGLGAVIAKRQIAIKDTLSRGYLIATKHSNNTDWWIIAPKLNSNCIFSIRVSPNGVLSPQKTCLGNTIAEFDFGEQVCISPNGKKYVRTLGTDSVYIYNFDNSTGVFSNQKKLIPVEDNMPGYFQGCVFSSNSRYLYTTRSLKVYQFDTEAPDIQASRTAVGDVSSIQQTIEKGELFECRLAPDGKIYFSSPFNYRYLNNHPPITTATASRPAQ
jgi:hypothetical protein